MTENSTPQKGGTSQTTRILNPLFDFSSTAVGNKPLTEETSSHDSVVQACNAILKAATRPIVQDSAYDEQIRESIDALTKCIQSHSIRNARIAAMQCLAMLAKASYAKLRVNPLLYATRDTLATELQDILVSDVLSTFCSIILEESDDEYASIAFGALDMLTSGNIDTHGILNDNIGNILRSSSPYAPSLRSLTPEDPAVVLQQFQIRILESTILPRLYSFLHRLEQFKSLKLASRSWGLIARGLLYAQAAKTDRVTYAKLWNEMDHVGNLDQFASGPWSSEYGWRCELDSSGFCFSCAAEVRPLA